MNALRTLVVLVTVGVAGCGGDADDTAPRLELAVETTVELDPGVEPVSLASLDGGDLGRAAVPAPPPRR